MSDTFGKGSIYEWTPTLVGGAVAEGDVLVPGETLRMLPNAGKPALLTAINVIVTDDVSNDTGPKLEICIFGLETVSLGTEDDVVSITDADAKTIVAKVVVETTDYTDWINSVSAEVNGINKLLRANSSAADPRDLRVGIIDRTGAIPTWTVGGLTVHFHLLHT
tara:strand:- start:34 stop:525 length:492 start_codon:yes stop_codon:yes gene_type:complete